MKRFTVSPAMVVAIIALVAATAGTALAATGQLVNIVDPAHSSQAAKVDTSGNLKVSASGTVKVAQNPTFTRSVPVGNFYANGFALSTVLQTTATLAVDRLNISIEDTGSSPWDGAIWYQPADSSGSCNGALTRVAVEAAQPGTSHLDQFQDPMVLKPAVAGQSWCLKASIGPFDTSTDGNAYVDVSGGVVSGTLSPPIGAAAQSARRSATGS